MAKDPANAKGKIDVRIAALEWRMEEKRDEMWKELKALVKSNMALTKENEALRAGALTPTIPFHNVILIGLVNPTLPHVECHAKAEVAATRQANKKKLVEHLKQTDSSGSFEADSWDKCKLRP